MQVKQKEVGGYVTQKPRAKRRNKRAAAESREGGIPRKRLHKICADAGVTTGALYFFFKDKEALFASIVEKPYRRLVTALEEHFEFDSNIAADYTQQEGDHDDLARMLVHHLYSNREAFLLLLTRAHGTSYENAVDEVVGLMESSYRVMAEQMASAHPGTKVNEYMLHWLTHMNIDAFIHLLTHECDEGKAVEHMSQIMDHIVSGWTKMILIPDDNTQTQ